MPKRRRIESQEDEVEIDGWPISSLQVFQIRMELRKCGLPSSKGKKQELVDRLRLHLQNPDPFNSLPDELVLKIIQMATVFSKKERSVPIYRRGVYNHTRIIGVMGRVSSRFNRIAWDQSMWRGQISLNMFDNVGSKIGFQEIVNEAIKSFLGKDVSDLHICSYPFFSAKLVHFLFRIDLFSLKCNKPRCRTVDLPQRE